MSQRFKSFISENWPASIPAIITIISSISIMRSEDLVFCPGSECWNNFIKLFGFSIGAGSTTIIIFSLTIAYRRLMLSSKQIDAQKEQIDAQKDQLSKYADQLELQKQQIHKQWREDHKREFYNALTEVKFETIDFNKTIVYNNCFSQDLLGDNLLSKKIIEILNNITFHLKTLRDLLKKDRVHVHVLKTYYRYNIGSPKIWIAEDLSQLGFFMKREYNELTNPIIEKGSVKYVTNYLKDLLYLIFLFKPYSDDISIAADVSIFFRGGKASNKLDIISRINSSTLSDKFNKIFNVLENHEANQLLSSDYFKGLNQQHKWIYTEALEFYDTRDGTDLCEKFQHILSNHEQNRNKN